MHNRILRSAWDSTASAALMIYISNSSKLNYLKTLYSIYLFTLLFLFSSHVKAQVAVSQTGETVVQNQTSVTLSFTLPMGEDRMLLVSTGTDLTALSVTYDGNPMVLALSSGGADLWTMVLGTDLSMATTADIVFTINGASPAQFLGINAISYTGVDQMTPVENLTVQAISAGAANSTITVASKVNDMVFDGVAISCLGCFSAPLAAPILSGTSLQNQISFVGLGFAGTGNTGTTPGASSVSPGWTFSGSSIFSGTHNGLNVRSSLPLPVELSSFTARQKKEDVILNWETQSEINSLGFEVQRSTDGNHFEKLAMLKSTGTSITTQRYQYIDLSPPSGSLYFRLKQMDDDGSFEYSDVRVLDLKKERTFSVFPNPAKNEIHVNAQISEGADFNIFDETGRLVKHFKISEEQSTIDISELPNGIYITTIKDHQNQLLFERLVKFE